MLHDTEPRHCQLRLELRQRTTITFEEQIEQESSGRIREGLEHRIVVEHPSNIGDHMVTCQAGSASGQVHGTTQPQAATSDPVEANRARPSSDTHSAVASVKVVTRHSRRATDRWSPSPK